MVAAYGCVAAATQMLWLTYAAITTESAHRYGVSVGAVGWLAEIFPLLYVVLAIPAGALLDRWFRPSLALGGALVAAGGLVRLGGLTFAWALVGQSLVALAQPVVMSAVAKLPGEYLPTHSRALGISLASAAGFLGMLAALLLGPLLGASRLELLLEIQAALAVLAAVALALALRRRGSGEGEQTAIEGGVARALWARPEIRVISGLAFLGFGVFVALSTWLQTLLHPSGISETAAGRAAGGDDHRGGGRLRGAARGDRGPRRGAPVHGGGDRRRLPRQRRLGGAAGDRREGGGDGGDGRRAAPRAAGADDRCRATRRRRGGHRGGDRVDGGQPRRAGGRAARAGARPPPARRVPGDGGRRAVRHPARHADGDAAGARRRVRGGGVGRGGAGSRAGAGRARRGRVRGPKGLSGRASESL